MSSLRGRTKAAGGVEEQGVLVVVVASSSSSSEASEAVFSLFAGLAPAVKLLLPATASTWPLSVRSSAIVSPLPPPAIQSSWWCSVNL